MDETTQQLILSTLGEIKDDVKELKTVVKEDQPKQPSLLSRMRAVEAHVKDENNRRTTGISRTWAIVLVFAAALLSAFADNALPRVFG